MGPKDAAVLQESVQGLHKRFDDFMTYSEKTNGEQGRRLQETLDQVKKINGSVAALNIRVHDIEFIQENCPAAQLRADIEASRDEMKFWIFLGKYWRTIALFIGIVLGTYSAITTIASNLKEERVKEVFDAVKPGGAGNQEEGVLQDAF